MEKELELGFISLQIDEDEGEAECGCKLVRAEANTGDPAFFLCPTHGAAPEMLEALKRSADQLDYADPTDKAAREARAILRAAIARAKS